MAPARVVPLRDEGEDAGMRGDGGMKTQGGGGMSLPRTEASEEASPATTSNVDFLPPEP